MVRTPVGAAAASAASAAITVSAAFLGALAVVVPVRPNISNGAGIVVDVKLLLAKGEPAADHGVEP